MLFKNGRLIRCRLFFILLFVFLLGIGLSTTATAISQRDHSVSPLNLSLNFTPSGWMGDTEDIKYDPKYKMDENYFDNNKNSVIKITYSGKGTQQNNFAGIYWQYPKNNWGQKPGLDLTGYKFLTFKARGENGGEQAEFKIGGIENENEPYKDSIIPAISTGKITLSNQWKEYSLDLQDNDLSSIIGGFCWVTDKEMSPDGCTIYLDDIVFK